MPAASNSTTGLRHAAVRGCGAWRWSTRRIARFPTSRASTPAPSSSSDRRASRSSPRAISCSDLRRSGTTRRSTRIARRPRSCTGSKTGRSRKSGGGCAGGIATTEYDIQQLMAGWFRDEGLVSDSAPNVSAAENAGNPHYLPTAGGHRAIRPDELVLLDLWGKLDRPGAVFADITWMGYTGRARTRPAGQGLRGGVRGARRRRGAGAAGGRGRPGAPRLAGRSRRLVGSAERRLRRSHPAPDRSQPGRRRSTAPA